MKLKAVVSHLIFSFSGALFGLQASPLVVQKSTIIADFALQFGDDFKKGPPWINHY